MLAGYKPASEEERGGRGLGKREHTKFICLTEPNFLRQEVETFLPACVLGIGATAILHRGSADTRGDCSCQAAHCCFRAICSEFLARSSDQVFDGPLPMLESSVILGDLAFGIVGVPGVDFDGDDEVEGGKVELESGSLRQSR